MGWLQLPQSRWFDHYPTQFDTVEINNTFYRLPETKTFAAWETRAPRGFVYAVKASRFLTHLKKLKGPVLYQLPPNWGVDVERLTAFLRLLPRRRHHAIEFRGPSWYRDDVFALLERYRVALCLHDMAGSATGRIAVGPFVYARFHGPTKYNGRYDDRVLEDCGTWLAAQMGGGRPIYAYFNNDMGGHAPRDAVRLRSTVARLTAPRAESRARASSPA